jgi:hypothetical protein
MLRFNASNNWEDGGFDIQNYCKSELSSPVFAEDNGVYELIS